MMRKLIISTAILAVSFAFLQIATTQRIAAEPTVVIQLLIPPKPAVAADILALAKNIYFEARGENIEGQLAVAQVVLNRTKSLAFPDTIADVVYQRHGQVCQFSWVCEKEHRIKDPYAWWQAKMLAEEVIAGNAPAPLPTDIYFYRVAKKHYRNHSAKRIIIGAHAFEGSPIKF